MKNTFAVSMALLLALTLGGSILGYRIATAEHAGAEGGAAEAPAPASEPQAPASEPSAPASEPSAAAAGGAASGESQPAAAAVASAPAGDAEAGKGLFAGKCAACHGENAAGGAIGPTLVAANGPTSWTDAEFQTALREMKSPARELKAPMMPFPADQLSDADITNIHEYLKTLN